LFCKKQYIDGKKMKEKRAGNKSPHLRLRIKSRSMRLINKGFFFLRTIFFLIC
jgi:hypothetical protein